MVSIFYQFTLFMLKAQTYRKQSVTTGHDSVVITVVCDMSLSHRAWPFYDYSCLIVFLLKSKDQKNSGEKLKHYLIIILKIIRENCEKTWRNFLEKFCRNLIVILGAWWASALNPASNPQNTDLNPNETWNFNFENN